jgi:alpha-galactosidase
MQEIVNPGMKVIESRRGNTGLPWTVLRPLAGTGRVWFGTISWSGTWGITWEQTPHQQVRVVGDYNSFDFRDAGGAQHCH